VYSVQRSLQLFPRYHRPESNQRQQSLHCKWSTPADASRCIRVIFPRASGLSHCRGGGRVPDLNEADLYQATITLIIGHMRQSEFLRVLEWLWDVIAGPANPPHIRWIPTGPLCKMSIHAAGHHSEDFSSTVLVRVVSSYSPSLKGLMHTRRNRAEGSGEENGCEDPREARG
jgi:hypothetical protein